MLNPDPLQATLTTFPLSIGQCMELRDHTARNAATRYWESSDAWSTYSEADENILSSAFLNEKIGIFVSCPYPKSEFHKLPFPVKIPYK